jgi:hypothetical protein
LLALCTSKRGCAAQYAQRYENVGLVYDLMNNKPGMADAKVAAEDVFRRAILTARWTKSSTSVASSRQAATRAGRRGRAAGRDGALHPRRSSAEHCPRRARQEMMSAAGLDSRDQKPGSTPES